jgi:hypothetical protein
VAGSTAASPFYTPMAIATWRPIVTVLERAGVVREQGGVYWFDVAAYLDLVRRDVRWRDLPGNTEYPVGKSVLVTSTDVRKSNSAAMYLALVSYVANGDAIVVTDRDVAAVLPAVSPLFLRQGFTEYSSEVPFEDYLVQGMGKSPMVMISESQFIQRVASADGSITPEMVLIYPDPTIFSKHTFVGLTANGIKLGDFVTNDPEMRTLATEYGFRTTDTAAFTKFVADHALAVPAALINVIDPPTYETLEAMITRLEAVYSGQGLPSPAPSGPAANP